MTEGFTGPIKTLRSCPASFGPLSPCVARPLSSRSAPGEALPHPGGANRLHGSRRGGGACFPTVLDSLQFSEETQQIPVRLRRKEKSGLFHWMLRLLGDHKIPDLPTKPSRLPGPRMAAHSAEGNFFLEIFHNLLFCFFC